MYNLDRIGRLKWSGPKSLGTPDIITNDFDRSVREFAISSDDRTLYLTAVDAGRVRIYSVPASGGEVKPLNPESRGVYSGIQLAGVRSTTSCGATWTSTTSLSRM